jgi:putative Flp pilus-assembly TadE/G-like protein
MDLLHKLRAVSRRGRSSTTGAVLVLAAIVFLVLILVVSLVIDGGLIYGKRAEISKAVDAAAIAGINNVSQGQGVAEQLARDLFAANYRLTSRDDSPPDLDIQFSIDGSGNQKVDITGTAHLRPLFLQVIPQFSVFDVHARAQAQRAKLVMSIVLDRSYSMRANGGCIGLPPAVDTFISFFDDNLDRAALATFASNARLDVPMTRPFRTAIQNAVPRNCDPDYAGFTFFDGGLQIAGQQNGSVVVSPGEQVVKVVVFFTDGLANTFQGTFDCPPSRVLNITSGDGGNDVTLLDPATGAKVCGSSNGAQLSCCPNLITFPSITGVTRHATGPDAGSDVRLEAKDVARDRARQIRVAGNVIYTIGLGDGLDQDFLREIANDPTSPTFDPSQPAGEFAFAPSAADLQAVFQVIARKILVRISI